MRKYRERACKNLISESAVVVSTWSTVAGAG